MRNRVILTLAGMAVAVTGLGQDGLSSSARGPRDEVDNSPVTCSEAHAVFQRIQDAMAKTLLIERTEPTALASDAKSVTRSQVVDEMDRLSKLFAPYYTLKPRTQYCDEKVLKFPKAQHEEAVRLIKLGFMEPVAPLEVGPKDSLTVDQFAEALGFFMERWADMTHMPSTKWSPSLMPDGAKPPPPSGSREQAP